MSECHVNAQKYKESLVLQEIQFLHDFDKKIHDSKYRLLCYFRKQGFSLKCMESLKIQFRMWYILNVVLIASALDFSVSSIRVGVGFFVSPICVGVGFLYVHRWMKCLCQHHLMSSVTRTSLISSPLTRKDLELHWSAIHWLDQSFLIIKGLNAHDHGHHSVTNITNHIKVMYKDTVL